MEGADTISIPAGEYTLSIPGTDEDAAATGDLDSTGDLTISGAGIGTTTIDAGSLDRAFHNVSGTLDLSALTVQNGVASPGGAVLVSSSASIHDAAFQANQAPSTLPTGTGGAVHVDPEASAIITNSQFTENLANYGGGAVASANTTTLSVSDSTFTSNNGGLGGGALYLNGVSATIENSTFSDNDADTGGAIHSNAAAVTVTNSTFVENQADNHGAIDLRVGTITVNNSTFSGNMASGIGDSLGDQPGQGGDLQVRNSIISGASTDNCGGTVVDLGNNLSWPAENI